MVEQCDTQIKSIEIQLVRVETCGCAEGYAKDGQLFTRYIVEWMIIASILVSFVERIIITRQYKQELSICNTSP